MTPTGPSLVNESVITTSPDALNRSLNFGTAVSIADLLQFKTFGLNLGVNMKVDRVAKFHGGIQRTLSPNLALGYLYNDVPGQQSISVQVLF